MDYLNLAANITKANHVADVAIGRMVAYIQQHGIDAYALNGKIKALEVGTIANGTSKTDVYQQWVELEPKWESVRNWLGY